MGYNTALYVLTLLLCFVLDICECARCGGGDACIYVNRDIGWVPRNESLNQPRPPPIRSDSWKRNDTTIFVSISSYRDKLCPVTLFNMFTKAAHPSRLVAAVIQQNVPGDIDCYEQYCSLMRSHGFSQGDVCPYGSNIKMKRLDGNSAKGPTWARSFGSAMITDEEFCMQTDSHMDFMVGWDSLMLEMWALTENEYGVLSTYVTDSTDFDNIKDKSKGINGLHEVPHLCIVRFHGAGGMPRNFGTKCLRMFPRPKLTNAVWGAGLSFAKCHAEKKVLYDPFTPGIFDGEEWSRAARYWTWGYDIYTPHRVYISHNYKKSQSDPLHSRWHSSSYSPADAILRKNALSRIRMLLHMDGPQENKTAAEMVRRGRYGLGDRRSFQQLVEFSGVDPVRRSTIRDRCGNIEYVPFSEHPLGPDYIPRFDSLTHAPLDEPDPGSIYYNAQSSSFKHPSDKDTPVLRSPMYIDPSARDKMKQKRIDVLADNINQRIAFKPHADKKEKDSTLYGEIAVEMFLFCVILFLCYYCMLPSRSTKLL
mmetsp:Transcript_22884/g.33438  ORF Transcript_22884/g.33438 Transcript_22884/m.33438 type:complete len:534 (+) Transcript_22884:211-1812(+)